LLNRNKSQNLVWVQFLKRLKKFNSDFDSKNQTQLQFDLTNWNGSDLPKQVPSQQWQIASLTKVLQFQLNLTYWNASDWPKQVPGQQWHVASLTKVFPLGWQHGGINWRVTSTVGILGGCSTRCLALTMLILYLEAYKS
jgi:hypothetical protein